LGLSIIYEIIKDHSGEISVKSEAGKGTSFHILLPQEKIILSEVNTNEQ
jgi:signal transduction histidine kinase